MFFGIVFPKGPQLAPTFPNFLQLSPEILKHIKKNEYLDMDKFIKNIVKLKYKVGVYPVAKDSWIDIGTLANYKKFNK